VFHRGSAPEECAELVLRVARHRPVSWAYGKRAASSSQTESRLDINDAWVGPWNDGGMKCQEVPKDVSSTRLDVP